MHDDSAIERLPSSDTASETDASQTAALSSEKLGDVNQPDKSSSVSTRRKLGCVWPAVLLILLVASAGAALAMFNRSPQLTEEELARKRNLVIRDVGDANDSQANQLDDAKNKDASGKPTEGNPDKQTDSDHAGMSPLAAGKICDLFETAPPDKTEHPLDTCLEVARLGLQNIRDNVKDYTATLIKRERIDGELKEEEFLFVKIREQKKSGETITTPQSVYLKFLAPNSVAGREVIYVHGRNDNRLIAHGNGFTSLITLNLKPDEKFAMAGNRYPLTEIGIETLALRMLEKGRRDRNFGECNVQIHRQALIDDRACTRIEIIHPVKRDHFEFHMAEIFIDDQYNVPVRYASYSWPSSPGGEPILEEEYTYRDLKLNVGLTDADFDKDNPEYHYP
jgi:hypothetical protein